MTKTSFQPPLLLMDTSSQVNPSVPKQIPSMAFLFPTRSRWVSCCCIFTVSITAAAIYWRAPRRFPNEANDKNRTGLEEEEAGLVPTLANALEIQSILNTSTSANSQWSPEPQWNPKWTELTVEYLPRQNQVSAAIASIPEAYPLEPRLKKEPPSIGEAFVSSFPNVGQLQPLDSQSNLTTSPFVAKPNVALTPNGQVAKQPLNSIATSNNRLPAWPDQTYSAVAAKDSSSIQKSQLSPSDLSTPNLLTGAAIRARITPPTPSAPANQQESGFVIKPNQPSIGNYILQPMRSRE